MWEAILKAVAAVLEIFADWPKRKVDKARRDYANWRAGTGMRKEARANRARLVESVDRLRDDKGESK